MGVADERNVLGRRAELHRDHRFRDQLGRHRADDMHAEDAVGRGVGEKLDEAAGITQRAGAAVGHERELTRLVLNAFALKLLLGLADPGDLRRGVDHPRDGVEIHVAVAAGYALRHRDAFLFRLVREHGAAHHVADRPHAGQARATLGVHLDEAALVEFEAHCFCCEPLRVRHASDGDDQPVAFELLRATALDRVLDRDALLAGGHTRDGGTQRDVETLFSGEYLPGFLRHRFVRRRQEGIQHFQHRDFGAEPPPDAAHFKADHAGADDAQLAGHLGYRQRAGVVEDQLVVERRARQRARARAGRHDDVPGRDRLRVLARHPDLPGARATAGKAAAAMEESNLVLLEQEHDAVVILLHHFVLALQHLRQIKRQALDLYAVIPKPVRGMMIILGGLQQGFRGNAANVGAGAAQRRLAVGVRPLVDAGGLQAQLRRANRGDVAARPAADYCYIKGLGHKD